MTKNNVNKPKRIRKVPSQVQKSIMLREIYKHMVHTSNRSAEVIRFFANKYFEEDVFGWDAHTPWKTKERTLQNYLREVKDKYFNFEEDVEFEKRLILSQLDDLFRQLYKKEKYGEARQVLRDKIKLFPSLSVKRIQHEEITDEDKIDTEIERLLKEKIEGKL